MRIAMKFVKYYTLLETKVLFGGAEMNHAPCSKFRIKPNWDTSLSMIVTIPDFWVDQSEQVEVHPLSQAQVQ